MFQSLKVCALFQCSRGIRATWALVLEEGQGLKKCLVFGSVTLDQGNTCGVCGNDLTGAPRITDASLDQPVAQA